MDIDFINIKKDITYSQRGIEENVKIKIILPLIESLGYNLIKDVNFEYEMVDIVLFLKNTPIFMIETKSWEQDVRKHKRQCLEYMYKLCIPYILISSGRESVLYHCLSKDEDIKELLSFSFNDLKNKNFFEKLFLLLNKEEGNNKFPNLKKEIIKKNNISIDQALRIFNKKALKYKPIIKTIKINDNNFYELASLYQDEIKNSIILSKVKIEKLADKYKFLGLRRRSKEIGLEYIDKSGPRIKKMGLLGIYPERAQIICSTMNFNTLLDKKIITQRENTKKILKFNRNINSISDVEKYFELLDKVFQGIHI